MSYSSNFAMDLNSYLPTIFMSTAYIYDNVLCLVATEIEYTVIW